MIEAHALSKVFHVRVPAAGRMEAIRSLLSRSRRDILAVKNVSFHIGRGEFVGYIGPNGAGKSTTIKMLCGILHPTSGHIALDGLDPRRHRKRVMRQIGVVFGQRTQLWWDLPVRDSFDILSAMYALDPAKKNRRLSELTDILSLGEILDTPVRKLSLGQRMRADLCASLLHDPDILFLDEPTIGLDVTAKRQIREHLQTINAAYKKTILLTTHDMDDVEQLCGRVLVINEGTVVYDGTTEGLRQRIGLPTIIRVVFQRPPNPPLPGAERLDVEHGDREVLIRVDRSRQSVMDVLRIADAWGTVEDVHVVEPDFEDVIHHVY